MKHIRELEKDLQKARDENASLHSTARMWEARTEDIERLWAYKEALKEIADGRGKYSKVAQEALGNVD